MSSEEKPTIALVLSLIGGVLIFLAGVLASAGFSTVLPALSAFYFVIILSISILVIVGALMLYLSPKNRKAWGIVVVVFSIASIIGSGGMIVGMILGIVGGAMAVAWKPDKAVPSTAPVITRICPQCGWVLTPEVKFCPNCGKSLT